MPNRQKKRRRFLTMCKRRVRNPPFAHCFSGRSAMVPSGWSTTLARMVDHPRQNCRPPSPEWSTTLARMVDHLARKSAYIRGGGVTILRFLAILGSATQVRIGTLDCKFDPGCKFDPNPNRDTACASLQVWSSVQVW